MKTMWQFKTRNFIVQWRIEDDVLDTSYMERGLAVECREKVGSGEWECFSSEIRVVHRATGITLGESYLGNSIYADPREFRDHFGMNAKGYGSYFSDMVREAIAQARETFPELQEKVQAVKLRTVRQLAAA